MSKVKTAFANYYKAERDRCEKTLVDILDILCAPGSDADQNDAVIARLERHYSRDPGEGADHD